jgi:hypothetical protein
MGLTKAEHETTLALRKDERGVVVLAYRDLDLVKVATKRIRPTGSADLGFVE